MKSIIFVFFALFFSHSIFADSENPTLGLNIDKVIFFKEFQIKKYKIGAYVSHPGKPVVEIINLPDGADFDREDFVLSWEPTGDQGNDPRYPLRRFKIYYISVKLSSTEDLSTYIKREVMLVVQDVPTF